MLLDIVFVFGLELDGRIGGDSAVVGLEPLAAVFCLEGSHYIPHTFVFAEEALVLASALDGGAGGDEEGHLLEDLAGSE